MTYDAAIHLTKTEGRVVSRKGSERIVFWQPTRSALYESSDKGVALWAPTIADLDADDWEVRA